MDDVLGKEHRIGMSTDEAREVASEASSYAMKQATDAMERFRGVVDQATNTLRDLTQNSGEWARVAQVRAGEMASQVRDQSQWAVGTISRQVEQYPMTSLVVAFGVGWMIGMASRRLW